MKNIKQTAIFLAARSGSKRLPNKHFLKLNDELMSIDLCIKRLKLSKKIKNIFLCTTKLKADEKFKNICKKHNINFFAGENKNVLKRFIDCATKNLISNVVRITADCPLIDYKLIDKCFMEHTKNNYDYTSNVLSLSFPDGLDVEIIKTNTLKKSYKLCKSSYNQEHVTPFIKDSKIFKKKNVKNIKDFSDRRWTLDKKKDFYFIKKISNSFYPKIDFSWQEILKREKKAKSFKYIEKRK